MNRDTYKATILLLCSTLCYGSVPIFLRYLSSHIDPWTVNGIRYSVSAFFWLPFVIINRNWGSEGIKKGSAWKDALIPSLINFIGQITWGLSPYFIPASLVGFLVRVAFLFTIIFGFMVIPEERTLGKNKNFYLGAFLCIVGTLALAWINLKNNGHGSLFGIILILATAVFWGGYAVSVRKYMAPYPVRLSFGIISIYTTAGLVVLMLLFGNLKTLGQIGSTNWLYLIVSGFFGVAISHVLYYKGIHKLGPIVANGVMMATPFITYLGAWLILGERLTLIQFFGGITIVLGGIILVIAKSQVQKVHVNN